MIYVFGDSHAECTFKDIPGVKHILVGSITMRRASWINDNTLKNCLEIHSFAPDDYVFFIFGEIDIRYKIKEMIKEDHHTYKEIGDLALAYVDRIVSLNLWPAKRGVVSIIPPNRKRDDNKHLIPENVTDQDRITYTKILNNYLKMYCIATRIRYLDVYSEYVDYDGALPDELSERAGSHINDRTRVKQLLKRLGLI